MRFRAHGYFNVIVQNRVLKSELNGPFNREAVEEYLHQLIEKVEQAKTLEIDSHLIVLGKSGMFTSCASVTVARLLNSSYFCEFKHILIVCECECEKRVLKGLYSAFLPYEKCRFRSFHSVDRAYRWLNHYKQVNEEIPVS